MFSNPVVSFILRVLFWECQTTVIIFLQSHRCPPHRTAAFLGFLVLYSISWLKLFVFELYSWVPKSLILPQLVARPRNPRARYHSAHQHPLRPLRSATVRACHKARRETESYMRSSSLAIRNWRRMCDLLDIASMAPQAALP